MADRTLKLVGEMLAGGEVEIENFVPWSSSTGESWGVTICWGKGAGRSEPIGVFLEPPAGTWITADGVRRIPVGQLVSDSRARILRGANSLSQSTDPTVPAHWREAAERRVDAFGTKRKRSLDGLDSDDRLQLVADTYRAAYRRDYTVKIDGITTYLRPRKAVAHRFSKSDSTAAKWIMEARVAGYLPPATAGKESA